jgi:hypothetical protein
VCVCVLLFFGFARDTRRVSVECGNLPLSTGKELTDLTSVLKLTFEGTDVLRSVSVHRGNVELHVTKPVG